MPVLTQIDSIEDLTLRDLKEIVEFFNDVNLIKEIDTLTEYDDMAFWICHSTDGLIIMQVDNEDYSCYPQATQEALEQAMVNGNVLVVNLNELVNNICWLKGQTVDKVFKRFFLCYE